MGSSDSFTDKSEKYRLQFNRGTNNDTKHGHRHTYSKFNPKFYRGLEPLFYCLDQRNEVAEKEKNKSNGLVEGT